MPYRVLIDEPYCRVWFSGEMTAIDLRDAADELRLHERDLGVVPDRLVDMSEVTSIGPSFHLAILAARVRGVQRFPNTFRSALVAPRVEVAGIARIFRTLNRNPQIEVEVFQSVAEAEAWLATELPTTPRRRASDQHGAVTDHSPSESE